MSEKCSTRPAGVDTGLRLAAARGEAWESNAPADVQVAAQVKAIRDAIEKTSPEALAESEFLSGALATLHHACRLFLGWHSRIESPVEVRARVDRAGIALTLDVRHDDNRRVSYELKGNRWRRGPGHLCSMNDVALEAGIPIPYLEGLVEGISTITDTVVSHPRREECEFIDVERAARAVGVPVELIRQWVASHQIPYCSLPGSDEPWFIGPEIRKWAKGVARKHGGLDVSPRVEVTTPLPTTPATVLATPECLRSIDGLRSVTFSHGCSGVYFLCQGAEVVYVGQSVNTGGRIATHQFEGTKVFDRAFVLPCRPDQLEGLERQLIDRLLPRYNADSKTRAMRRCGQPATSEGGAARVTPAPAAAGEVRP